MFTVQFFYIFFVLLCQSVETDGAACGSCVHPNNIPSTYSVTTYQESREHVENPHRGFTNQYVTHSTSHTPLTKSTLDDLRRRIGATVAWRTVVLDTFRTSPISQDYLNKIRDDLAAAESASFTLVLRFCYIFDILPNHPYGDAEKNIVLNHISQLKPIFHQYERVITSVEAGFIGAWGEWHHSEYFPQTDMDARREVLLALLHAVPMSIQVQVRYPSMKMGMMGASTIATFQQVQQGDDNARTGHHNDCFLSSDMDVGTYHNKAVEYPYLEQDTRYTIMGGETCSLTSNHRHECPTARQELAMFHWTWLNEGFNRNIYNVWKQQGCFEEIDRRLGYRLTINKAILPNAGQVDGDLCFHMEFTNTGYAAPVKNVGFFLVLQSTASASQYYAARVDGVDLRNWQPGSTITVASTVRLTHLPEGDYKVLLLLRDPLMGDHSDYNVLLATSGVPLYSSGLNDLKHTIHVSGHHASTSISCSAANSWQAPSDGHYSRIYTGSFN